MTRRGPRKITLILIPAPASGTLIVDERRRKHIQWQAISANIGIVSLMIITGGLSSDILQLYASRSLGVKR